MKYVYSITTEDGTPINLTMTDLSRIYNIYRFLSTREYIQDNYFNLTSTELDTIAYRVIELENKYNYSENEAIKQALAEAN